MTIPNELVRAGPYTGNGVTTTFAFAFKLFATSELIVTFADSAGERVLTLSTDYSVALNADQDNSPGGSITYPLTGAPLTASQTLTLSSGVSNTQESELPNGGGFNASIVERMADKATILVKQLLERSARALRQPISDSVALNDLPTVTNRASKVLAFDAAGQPIAQASVPTSGVLATAYMETLLDDADAGTAQTTLGLSAYFKTLVSAATAAALRALFTPLTTKGDMWVFGAADARKAAPADGYIRMADAAQADGWQDVPFQTGATLTTPTLTTPTLNGALAGTSIATQAEQEAAAATDKVVAPGRQHFHPSAAKAWLMAGGGGTPVISASYNIASITDAGVGTLTVTLATAFSSVNWCPCVGSSQTGTGTRIANFDITLAGGGSLVVADAAGTFADPGNWYFAAFGDQ